MSNLSYGIASYNHVVDFYKNQDTSGLVTNDTSDTYWVAVFDRDKNEKIIAVTALTFTKNTCRLRSSLVDPAYRGQNVYRNMIAFSEKFAKNLGAKTATAFFNARTVPYAQANGYTVNAPNKNGVYYAKKAL